MSRIAANFFCAALVVGLVCPLHATEYFVSPAGLDANPGTLAQPWRTVQKAANLVVAGDIVNLRGNGGAFNERITVTNRNGTALAPIVFRTYPGDPMAVVETTLQTSNSGNLPLFKIENSDYVTVQGIEFRNCKTVGSNAQQRNMIPMGIFVKGGCAGVAIRNCKIHDIWQSSTSTGLVSNGFGVLVSGDVDTPIDGFIFDGNEVYNLRTGASESVALNGNVTNFQVTNNVVHDCNNIGIDFIGFEETHPTKPELDQARFGVCSGNTVYNIDSSFNPAYGGNFGGSDDNGTRAAPGLYVDGGRDIILERNHVYLCNFAISVGSEHEGREVTNVTVRNNILHHCHVGGIVIGGSGEDNGGTRDCSFTHNTIYNNDTTGQGGGQFSIQENVSNVIIRRNVMATTAEFAQFVLKTNTSGDIGAGAIDWNSYRYAPGGTFEFYWEGADYSVFADWQGAGVSKDANSTITTGSLGFVNAAPSSTSPAGDFAITRTSVLRDSGDSAAAPFAPAAGEKDYFGRKRVSGTRVDIGAHELALTFAIWSLDTTGTSLATNNDGDFDGAMNLEEYAFRTHPGQPDSGQFSGPGAIPSGWRLTFPYQPDAADLRYIVKRSSNLNIWSEAARLHLSDGTTSQIPGVMLTPDSTLRRIQVDITGAELIAAPGFWKLELEIP